MQYTDGHVPVLLQEVAEGLKVAPRDTVADATVGMGGHAKALAEMLSENGIFIGIDRDEEALSRAKENLPVLAAKLYLVNGNYRHLKEILAGLKVHRIDKLLIDLGMSSAQIHSSKRGFTFLENEPLLMTFEKNPSGVTAKDIVNSWSEERLADIIYGYGEERFAKKIAGAICRRRGKTPIETTFDLVSVIAETVPSWYKRRRIHFATKTFQALRIAVNDELGSLKEGLESGITLLRSGGRVAVITFHSTEDRLVKNMFRDSARSGKGMLVNKKPILPQREEIRANPRARSAKLRIFERI